MPWYLSCSASYLRAKREKKKNLTKPFLHLANLYRFFINILQEKDPAHWLPLGKPHLSPPSSLLSLFFQVVKSISKFLTPNAADWCAFSSFSSNNHLLNHYRRHLNPQGEAEFVQNNKKFVINEFRTNFAS